MKTASKNQRERGDQKKWRQNNKSKIKIYNEQRKQNKEHDITENEWNACKTYFHNSCAYCGISEELAKSQQGHLLHREHVDHEGANDLSNCVPACRSCNSQKWIYKLNEWYNETNPIYSVDRLNLIIKWLNNDYKKYVEVQI